MMIFYHISSIRHKKKNKFEYLIEKETITGNGQNLQIPSVRNQYLFCQQSDDGDESRVRS